MRFVLLLLVSLLLLTSQAADATIPKVKSKAVQKKVPHASMKQAKEAHAKERSDARKQALALRGTPKTVKPIPAYIQSRLQKQTSVTKKCQKAIKSYNKQAVSMLERNIKELKRTSMDKVSQYFDGKLATVTVATLVCASLGITDLETAKRIEGALGGVSASEIKTLQVDPSKVVTGSTVNITCMAITQGIAELIMPLIVDTSIGIPTWAIRPIIAFLVKRVLEKCI